MKYRLRWKQQMVEYWYLDVEADSPEDAEAIFDNCDHITGDEVLESSDFIESDFLEVTTPIKDDHHNGVCPDCQYHIPFDMTDGGECANCGHVFYDPIEISPEEKDLMGGGG